jgi:flagellar basal body-associated protein FliL
MKKTTIILLCVAAVVCMALTGFTGYYIGSKSHKQDTTQVASNPLEDATTTDAIDEATLASIKEELKDEVKEEVRTEIYDEVYEQAMADVETELQKRLDELEAEQNATEEATTTEESEGTTEAPAQQSSNRPSGGGNSRGNGGSTETEPKVAPYIHVHDVTASASGGTAAIEVALNSAVDGSSGTVMCDPSTITGTGTFPVYWTATDGATATSYITITE